MNVYDEMPNMESEKRAKLEEQLRYLQKREAEQESVGEIEGSGQARSALDNLGLQIEKAHALVSRLEDRLDPDYMARMDRHLAAYQRALEVGHPCVAEGPWSEDWAYEASEEDD